MEQTFTYTTELIAAELNKWHISNYEPGYQELSAQQQECADIFTKSDFEKIRFVSLAPAVSPLSRYRLL